MEPVFLGLCFTRYITLYKTNTIKAQENERARYDGHHCEVGSPYQPTVSTVAS